MLQDPWPLRISAWRLRRQAACSAAVICLACSASPITLNTHHACEDFTSLERVHWCSLLQGRVSGGDIVHCGRVLAAGWCPGTACCSVSGPRRVAATTTVAPVARLLAGTGGCCSVWPGRLQCLCSLQHRHALHYTVATSRVHRTAH